MNTEVVKNSGKDIALTRSKFQIWSIFKDGGDKILKKISDEAILSHLEPNMRAIFEIVMSPCDVMYPKF